MPVPWSKPRPQKMPVLIWLALSILVLFLAIFVVFQNVYRVWDRSGDMAAHGTESPILLEELASGRWNVNDTAHWERWIPGPRGEDGYLLRIDTTGHTPFARVYDVSSCDQSDTLTSETCARTLDLLNSCTLLIDDQEIIIQDAWPSPNLQKLLLLTGRRKKWRHSSIGQYWILDVGTQAVEGLLPAEDQTWVQWASWSPTSTHVLFARDNNLLLRHISSGHVSNITEDGNGDIFNGVPDWVYEEEILQIDRAAWWSLDGQNIVFLRLNDSMIPDYETKFFFPHTSAFDFTPLSEAEETYAQQFKFPFAGGPIPIADLLVYNLEDDSVFALDPPAGIRDRVILEVLVISNGRAITRETNRSFDVEITDVVNFKARTRETVRFNDVTSSDGGWVEVDPPATLLYVPSDPANGRPDDGYIALIIHEGYRHLGYYTPLESREPVLLTSGPWEVSEALSVDLALNKVYFTANKNSRVERHAFGIDLEGGDIFSVVQDNTTSAFYSALYSSGAGYLILSYEGPQVPWKTIISTESNRESGQQLLKYMEVNERLTDMVNRHAMPTLIYGTIQVDGMVLQTLERRPPLFNSNKRYPVLFAPYGGPDSQLVRKKFLVGYEDYLASSLGYIIVSVDGRGTGNSGRDFRCIVRDQIGLIEAYDQIAAGKVWAAKSYVDESRMGIWGWSFGGYLTLKTLEQDRGRTFQYGMAVAALTDWRFYDFAYTERVMHTPQQNPLGYSQAKVSNMSALNDTVRFLLVQGTADDNVHLQNSMVLVDSLIQAGVENYDMLYFPDSRHGLFYHKGYIVAFDRLTNWLVNAFNKEWEKVRSAEPHDMYA